MIMMMNSKSIATMKNLFTRLMLVAVAAMGFVACQEGYEDVTITPEAKEIVMTFVAEAPDTRTSVAIDDNVAKYSWSEGDKVGFYYVATNIDYKKKGNSKEAVIADDRTATFTASFTPKDGASSYNIGAFYPGNSWMSHATENPFSNVNVKISNEQILTDGSFDPTADLMMSKPFMGVELNADTVKTLEFSRIAAIGKMNLKLTDMVEGEVIKSVKFTLAEGPHFNGPVVLDLEHSTYELGTTNTFNYVNLTGSLAANTDRTAIFFTCFPGEYSGAYTIEVETDKATYSKEGTLTTALVFTAGDVLNFNASVSNRVEKVVDTTPSITIDTTPVSFDYNAKEGTIAATLKNLEISDVTVTSSAQWLAATLAEDALNYNATANEGDERYATVTLSAKGIDDIVITFTQAAKPAEVTGVWTLVTDASTLAVGDKIIIAAANSYVALSTTQNDNNRGQAAITKDGDTVAFNNDVQILTVEAGNKADTFAFNTGSGYLYAASSSKNYLRTEAALSDNSSWTITIDAAGVATIIAQGTNTRKELRYNDVSSIFSCYASGQQDVAIYRLGSGANTGGDDNIGGDDNTGDNTGEDSPVTITLDCTSQPFTTDLPSGSSNASKQTTTYTDNSGYSWTIASTGGYYFNSSYLMCKPTTYITMPVVENLALTSISLYCNNGASASVKYTIVGELDDNVIGAEKTGVANNTTPLTWELADTIVSTAYRIKTTSKNGQITKIVLTYTK